MTRHETRIAAFQLMFAKELNSSENEELIAAVEETEEPQINQPAKEIFAEAMNHKEEFDEIIGQASKTRAVSRISKAVLSILRLALYEIKYDESIPESVAINEAVLIAKEYCDEADASFINGVLGTYVRSSDKND